MYYTVIEFKHIFKVIVMIFTEKISFFITEYRDRFFKMYVLIYTIKTVEFQHIVTDAAKDRKPQKFIAKEDGSSEFSI